MDRVLQAGVQLAPRLLLENPEEEDELLSREFNDVDFRPPQQFLQGFWNAGRRWLGRDGDIGKPPVRWGPEVVFGNGGGDISDFLIDSLRGNDDVPLFEELIGEVAEPGREGEEMVIIFKV
ncbi:kinase-like domain-containing protein [Emericellopsis cladophorae]|uniref:Kinase-like domain-containing protein n=1 Tax=Emericellopsis cladophorae TaxID=2686198 RepID=A0A9P9XWJ0_9HYPO|nr:kinase-like domain-containing protein [Emericellopsis cladophorae]KAI6778649.1 kinase-like domain-containing protein [Emericellopsis cladophorae]